jgi:hypothetical protein
MEEERVEEEASARGELDAAEFYRGLLFGILRIFKNS